MDSNQLLHYLRGFFELVAEPTPEQIRALRVEILQAKPVTAEIIPVEVANPMRRAAGPQSHGDCGCGK
jgi:hypothetical protein